MIRQVDATDPRELAAAISSAVTAVRRGQVVVVPTESSYALATDAFRVDGVARIRHMKNRDDTLPLPVAIGRTVTADGLLVDVSSAARALMQAFWPGMLTVIGRTQPALTWSVSAPGDHTVSVRMPLHPVAWQLAHEVGPLALTAANIAGSPAPVTCEQAASSFAEAATMYFDVGPLPEQRPSTVIDVTGPVPTLVRPGAISLDQLRSVADVIDPSTPEPPALPEDGQQDPGDPSVEQSHPDRQSPA